MRVAILILLVYNQLMVITTSNYNEIAVKNEIKMLKSKLLVFSDKMEHPEENTITTRLKQIPDGSFVRPPKVNTTLIKNKLNDIQNNVTKLNAELMNNNHNLADIKDRITTLEQELENLKRFYDDEVRELKNTLEKLQSTLSNLIFNNYNGNGEKLIVEKYNEFLEAIKGDNYRLALLIFSTIHNETVAKDLIKTTYVKLDNINCFFNFIDHLKDMNKKLLIYRLFNEILEGKNLIEICKMFKNRMKLYYDIHSNKMPYNLQNIATNMLTEIDKRIDVWLTILTAFQRQDAIVKIRYHQRLFGPTDYLYTVQNKYIDIESYKTKGGRTAILSCYPIDCT